MAKKDKKIQKGSLFDNKKALLRQRMKKAMDPENVRADVKMLRKEVARTLSGMYKEGA